MPLQGEYEPSTAAWVNQQVTEYEGSGGTEGTLLRGVPTVVVTMVGASTGKLRKHPVMRVEHDGTYAAVASKGGAPKNPTWVGNLRKNPLVEVQDGTAHGEYRAREASDDERAAWWKRAVEVWPDYDAYQAKTDRQIPIFLLEPAS
jgi:F420H(2)-dependent quinone reductase